MHAAFAAAAKGPFFYWNVDGAVGKNGANNREDVLFVQWCFYKYTKWPQALPGLVNTLKLAPVSGLCDGSDKDPLVAAIKAYQQSHNMMVDGRVSSVPKGNGGQFSGSGGKSPFLIIMLNQWPARLHPTVWPRIDLMPEFVWVVKDQATAPFNWS